MRFGSVCSGIEAASVAFTPLGWSAAWFSEIEPFPSAVLAHHYPDVPNMGDMTALPALIAGGLIEAPDILCGGTPCQAFSVAGLRRSLEDARGNLSLVFCETANAIDDARPVPCIVLWENVPGVLSTHDNAFGCFLAGLAGEDDPLEPPGAKWANAGVVYGPRRTVAWRTLDAQYFGLAQRRRRVFVVASARGDFDPVAVLFEFDGVRRDTAPSREAGQGAAGGAAQGAASGGVIGPLTAAHGPNGHGGSGLATDKGAVLAFGGNRTSGPIDVAAAVNAHGGAKGRLDFESETFVAHSVCLGSDPIHARELAQPITRRNGDPGTIATAMQVRRLTPRECERLQGFPDDYTLIPYRGKPAADGPRYKALGNSWAVPCVRWIGARIAAHLP